MTLTTSTCAVGIVGSDQVLRAGLETQLRGRMGLRLVEPAVDPADVVVIALSGTDDDLEVLRRVHRNHQARLVAVVGDIDDGGVLNLIENGATGVLRRADATPELLQDVILRAARGDGAMPDDLLGGLLRQVKRLQQNVLTPRGLTISGLTSREVEVLALVADGFDTKSIASQLCYSERTIKNVIQDVMRRFGLKNRSHAVAFALREGYI